MDASRALGVASGHFEDVRPWEYGPDDVLDLPKMQWEAAIRRKPRVGTLMRSLRRPLRVRRTAVRSRAVRRRRTRSTRAGPSRPREPKPPLARQVALEAARS